MKSIAEVMTRDIAAISPQDNLKQAAQAMKDWDVGALPVCDGQRLVGMLTDRDITVRAVATGRPPEQIRVSEMMTDEVLWCYADQSVGEVLQQMGDAQVRRIPVINRDMQLVGMVSLGDLATRQPVNVEDTLEGISTPSQPNRPSADEILKRNPQSGPSGGRP